MHSVLVIVQLIETFLPLGVRGDATLTTAVPWKIDISVKPTTWYRRIDVHTEEQAGAPDIFHKIDNKDFRRRNRGDGDVWNWDYWCQLQAQKGNCSVNVKRYYYHSQLDQCDTFTYSGCSGNKNNFETLSDCETHCKGVSIIMQTKRTEKSISCALQPNVGLCVALFDKYYYDVNEGSCKIFAYSGCGGNRNRFGSAEQCQKKCGLKKNIEDKY